MGKRQGKGGGTAEYRKELARLVSIARDNGWRVDETADGYAFKAPVVHAHMTASDVRAIDNLKAQLRRQGLPV